MILGAAAGVDNQRPPTPRPGGVILAGMNQSEDFKAGIRRAMEIVVADGVPGPGGVNIANGIPSEIYIGIGRGRYEGENGEYDLAEDTADSVRHSILVMLGREIGEPVQNAYRRPAKR